MALAHHPVSLPRAFTFGGIALALSACTGSLPGTPVAADELCAQIAEVVCDTDRACFPDHARIGCVAAQRDACTEVVQPLVDDPRLGYDELRAGAFVRSLETRAGTCWESPVDYDRFLDAFVGTGAAGADCTPPRMDETSLRTSSLSCAGNNACRIHLRADGSPEGVCELRSDSTCSHALDCGAGEFCSLPARWQPGVWGECRPLRAEGWTCASDLECESRHCAGTCSVRPDLERPLAIAYEALVLDAEPVGYLRFEPTSGRYADATGNGHSAQVVGAVTHEAEGAIADDTSGALVLPGAGAYVVIPAMDELAEAEALSLEIWFRRDVADAAQPILELFDGETAGLHVWNHDRGDKLYANLVDVESGAHTIMSGEGAVLAETWHHAVVTYDGTTGRLYLDGARVGEIAAALPLRLDGDLHVGHRAAMGEGAEVFFAGQLDELAVYDRALDAAEIREHHDAGVAGARETPFPLFAWLAN